MAALRDIKIGVEIVPYRWQAGDVIAVKCPGIVGADAAARIKANVREQFDLPVEARIVVLDGGASIEVLRNGE